MLGLITALLIVATPVASARGATITVSQTAPATDDKPCTGRPEQDHRSALCAQWVSAEATKDAAYWALLSAIFTAASVVGVIGALVLTTRSNKIARDTADRQLRAYVGPIGAAIFDYKTYSLYAVIDFQNFGQTPAFDVSVKGTLKFSQSTITRQFEYQASSLVGVLDPQSTGHLTVIPPKKIWINSEESRRLKDKGNRLTVFFEISYKTLNENITRRIVYYLDDRVSQNGDRLMMSVAEYGQGESTHFRRVHRILGWTTRPSARL